MSVDEGGCIYLVPCRGLGWGGYWCLVVVLEVYGGGHSICRIRTVVNCSKIMCFVGG